MPRQTLEHLNNNLLKRQQELASHLSEGAVEDFAKFKEIRGKIAGIVLARQEIADLLKRLKVAEGDD